MEGMRHRVPNSGKVLGERFVLLSSATPHCPSSSLLPRLLLSPPTPSLCVWLAWLGGDLFCSPANAICCYSQRLPGYEDGQCVYTSLECGIASTLPWAECVYVCGGRLRGGGSLRKRKGHRNRERERERERACRQAWLRSTFTRQFYYLLVDRNSQSAPIVWLEKKLSGKILHPCWNFSFQITKANVAKPARTEDDSEQWSAVLVAAILGASSLHGGIVVQSPVDEHVVGSCGRVSVLSAKPLCKDKTQNWVIYDFG